jgi:myo-inositol 2-dehydrogenase / D-chiro-inositol 1-dehydrogenase
MSKREKSVDKVAQSRRSFLKTSAVATGAALASRPYVVSAAPETKQTFKAVLIGCGGRGNGAVKNHLDAVEYLNKKLGWQLTVEFVGMADWFENRAKAAGKRYNVPEDKCFGGPENYKKVLEQNPDIVLMAQAPVFRPLHFETVIKAGKHVFMEKPAAVDPPGVRQMLAAGEEATKKGLCVVAGTQRRHSKGYVDGARQIEGGQRGKVVAGRVAWNMGRIFTNTPVNPTSPDRLISPWQIWVEMSGDHICEQHVHNLDIANWYIGTHPESAGGFGFRARRVAGNMYDFFSVDLEYPNKVHVHSMCRQVSGCWNWVGEDFNYGAPKPEEERVEVPDPYEEAGYPGNPYEAEHAHLLYGIVKGTGINETQSVAWATAAAILARESAYTGQRISWKEMFDDPGGKFYNLQLKPTAEDFETDNVVMLKDGDIRIPGG